MTTLFLDGEFTADKQTVAHCIDAYCTAGDKEVKEALKILGKLIRK